jgi:predicted phage terminase large subunit-like protein
LHEWPPERLSRLRREAEAELCRRSLAEFVRRAWPAVDPTPLTWNWHVDAICSHLQAVTEGRIRNLLINIPPGHAKSMLVSVMWPAWEWARDPGVRTLFGSYSIELALRDSVKCRDVVTSEWYRGLFRPNWVLKKDQNAKTYFVNTAKGFRYSLSVGGQGTGWRGNKVVVDDPLNAKDQFSARAKKDCAHWWNNIMSSRLNDKRTGSRVVIMQRLAEDDLSGVLLEQGGYEHLCLMSEFEPDRRCTTSIGWSDPRTEPGEPLFPEMFPPAVLAEIRKELLEFGFAGQHQQAPVPSSGGLFKREWFPVIDAAPAGPMPRARYWDLASTIGGDATCGLKMARTPDGLFVIEDIVHGRWSPYERDQVILQTAKLDGRSVPIHVEQEPGSSGVSQIASLVRMLAGFVVRPDKKTGDKTTRAEPFAVQCQAGNVRLVAGPHANDFLAEVTLFPFGKHDDFVDGASGAFEALANIRPSGPAVVGGKRDAANIVIR